MVMLTRAIDADRKLYSNATATICTEWHIGLSLVTACFITQAPSFMGSVPHARNSEQAAGVELEESGTRSMPRSLGVSGTATTPSRAHLDRPRARNPFVDPEYEHIEVVGR